VRKDIRVPVGTRGVAPRLDPAARAWLKDALARLDPGHAWIHELLRVSQPKSTRFLGESEFLFHIPSLISPKAWPDSTIL
jgi:hypothetical protein